MVSNVPPRLEEPIRDESPEAYETLRRLAPQPLALGEEFASKWQFLPFIERGLASYARLDVCNVGGFTEAMKVAGWAEAHYIDLMPHNPLSPICTAACGFAAHVEKAGAGTVLEAPFRQTQLDQALAGMLAAPLDALGEAGLVHAARVDLHGMHRRIADEIEAVRLGRRRP